MCGIVGYIGRRQAAPLLLAGLARLEYRGYDSAGMAVQGVGSGAGEVQVVRSVGRIEALAEANAAAPLSGVAGIGHTRWATHGPATEANAHPHFGGDRAVAVVHNGVIENYRQIKQSLLELGYCFASETDTEAVAHLIAHCLREEMAVGRPEHPHRTLLAATSAALAQLRGTYGLVAIFRDWPDVVVAARLGSPLVVGVGEGEHFLASDASALAGQTGRIVYLADHQVALITAAAVQVSHRDQGVVRHRIEALDLERDEIELADYPHYMLKEICEQGESLANTMRGRIDEDHLTAKFGGLNLTPRQLRGVNRILLTACGTSWHAALVGEYLIERFARIPVEVEYASELRYRNPPIEPGTLLFAITQSGETADTLAALCEMKRRGHPTQAICNVVGSSIAQEADGGIYLHAGPEIGVASTKAYTSQVMVLTLLALYFGRLRDLSASDGERLIDALRAVPEQIAQALETNDVVRRIAGRYCHAQNFLYLGRQFDFPTALEGALKLKEISYIHAEGYPAAEMKHGPIALVDEDTPSVFVMPPSGVYDKVMANVEEVKARGGPVIAVVAEGDDQAAAVADELIVVPRAEDYVQPLLSIVPLQLLAYHIAVLRGCDVDKPRNLAKSVTVE